MPLCGNTIFILLFYTIRHNKYKKQNRHRENRNILFCRYAQSAETWFSRATVNKRPLANIAIRVFSDFCIVRRETLISPALANVIFRFSLYFFYIFYLLCRIVEKSSIKIYKKRGCDSWKAVMLRKHISKAISHNWLISETVYIDFFARLNQLSADCAYLQIEYSGFLYLFLYLIFVVSYSREK